MSKNIYSTANLTDVELKDQGNRLFSARKFDDAINCYTKAIVSISKKIEKKTQQQQQPCLFTSNIYIKTEMNPLRN